MLAEQSSQLPPADAQPVGQRIDIGLVQRAHLDERQAPGDGVRRAPPGAQIRRRLRTAPQARSKARFLGGRGGGEEDDVFASGRPRRADRAAIDAGGPNAGEKPAVEPGVAQADGAVARLVVHIHACH